MDFLKVKEKVGDNAQRQTWRRKGKKINAKKREKEKKEKINGRSYTG